MACDFKYNIKTPGTHTNYYKVMKFYELWRGGMIKYGWQHGANMIYTETETSGGQS